MTTPDPLVANVAPISHPGTPPAGDYNLGKTERYATAELIAAVRKCLETTLELYKRKRARNKVGAIAVHSASIGLSSLTTILLGWSLLDPQAQKTVVSLKNAALCFSALATAATSLEAVFDYRALWVAYNVSISLGRSNAASTHGAPARPSCRRVAPSTVVSEAARPVEVVAGEVSQLTPSFRPELLLRASVHRKDERTTFIRHVHVVAQGLGRLLDAMRSVLVLVLVVALALSPAPIRAKSCASCGAPGSRGGAHGCDLSEQVCLERHKGRREETPRRFDSGATARGDTHGGNDIAGRIPCFDQGCSR